MRPVTGGTDTHLALLDLQGIGVSGKDAEERCGRAGIVLNKNAIPYDPQPPSVASGIRVGSPSVTTQGMVEGDMKEVASLIARAVRDEDGSAAEEVRRGVAALVEAHPAYPRAVASAVREYLLVLLVAAAVTYLLTPLARRFALGVGAMTEVRDRDVHATPTPRLGGLAMYGGVAAAFLVAHQLPALQSVFTLLRRAGGRWSPAACSSLVGLVDDVLGPRRAVQARRPGRGRRASWCCSGCSCSRCRCRSSAPPPSGPRACR